MACDNWILCQEQQAKSVMDKYTEGKRDQGADRNTHFVLGFHTETRGLFWIEWCLYISMNLSFNKKGGVAWSNLLI